MDASFDNTTKELLLMARNQEEKKILTDLWESKIVGFTSRVARKPIGFSHGRNCNLTLKYIDAVYQYYASNIHGKTVANPRTTQFSA